jgi:serine/threonine protein kinase
VCYTPLRSIQAIYQMKSCPICQASYPTHFAVCPQDGTPLVDAGTWAEGTLVRGKYRILNKIGQGGMGSVYKAVHVTFDELRAIKVISPELIHDELFLKRFKHEAVITRRLQHANAVRVDDIDEAEDGRPFIVMEYIEGKSLRSLLENEGAMAAPRVCAIIKQVSSALDAAHRLGMIHRDIKPDNIVLIDTPEGEQAKVLDFGIAKIKEGRSGATGGMTLTGTGVVIGTPQYMSPEQAMGKRGDQLDGRSDLYSLGIVMYQMLTGDLPFRAETTMEMLLAHLQKLPTDIHAVRPELQIPDPVARIVMRLLEKKPEQRPADARTLIAEIERAEAAVAASAAVPPAAKETFIPASRSSYSPHAAEALRSALSSSPPPARRSVAPASVATPPPAPPHVVESPPAAAPAPRPAPQARPVPPPAVVRPAKQSQWGIWAAVGILIVGLAGGTWYFVDRAASHAPKTQVPAPTSPSPPVETTAPASQPAGQPAETAPQPIRNAEHAPTGSEPVRPAVETPKSSSGERGSPQPQRGTQPKPAETIATQPPSREVASPTKPEKPAVDPKKISAAIKLGDFFLDRGAYDDAIQEYQRGLNVDPTNQTLKARIERARRAKAAEERLNQ